MPIDPKQIVIGDRIGSTKWVACRKLGQGGMGVVFEVVKPPGVRGAMKVMFPHLAARREFVDSFIKEVRLTATIDHRNVVRVTDFDELEDGTLYYIMELLQGSTLRATLSLRAGVLGRDLSAGLLKPPVVYQIVCDVCAGLERAHAAGIAHRDLKPENIMIHAPEGDRPIAKVGDFGIAVLYLDKRQRGVSGTPKYMAPEQLRDERATPRTDIYAIGLMTYEMLTGRFPWDLPKKAQELLREEHLKNPPIPPSRFVPTLSRGFDDLLLSAIAIRPEDRPRSASEFSYKLCELVDAWTTGESPHVAVSADINATDPTFEGLADLGLGLRETPFEGKAGAGQQSRTPTFGGMTPPPLDGRSLELALSSELPALERPRSAPAAPVMPPPADGRSREVPPVQPSELRPQEQPPATAIGHTEHPTPPTDPVLTRGQSRWDDASHEQGGSASPVLAVQEPSTSYAGTSVSRRISQLEPVVTISRRTMYRALVAVPVMLGAGLVLVLALVRAPSTLASLPAPRPSSSSVDAPPSPASLAPVVMTPVPASAPPALVAPPASTSPSVNGGASAPSPESAEAAAPVPTRTPSRKAPTPAAKPNTRPPAASVAPPDDGRDLLETPKPVKPTPSAVGRGYVDYE